MPTLRNFRSIISVTTLAVGPALAGWFYFSEPVPEERKANARRSGALEALEFWSASRAYPNADIPPDGYTKAFAASKRSHKEVRRELTAGSTWEPIGPTNLHGRTNSIAINPSNRNTVYIGTASGGLWRSYGGGLGGDWEMVDLGYPALGIGAILIDPADTSTMYVGTGEVYRYLGALGGLDYRPTRGSYGIGILKSTDAGATWTKSLDWTYEQQRGIQAMKFNPLNPSTIFAATTEGIYKSTDAGANWNVSAATLMATDVVVHREDTSLVLGAFGNFNSAGRGVYRSIDAGGSWALTPGLPSYTGKTLLDAYYSNNHIVYASVADSTTGVGWLYRTTDFGGSWTQMSNNTTNAIFGVQGWYSHYPAVHKFDSSIVFHASVGGSKSLDGGVTFGGVSGLYSDNHAYAVDPTDPDIIFSVNDDGVYRSTNFGQSFTDVGAGLQTGQLYKGLGSSATDSLLAIVQSQDHIPGYLYNGGLSWPRSAADESGWTAINQSNDNIMYAVTRNGQSVRKSTNRGVTFFNTVNLGSLGAWNTPIVLAPSNPNIIYVGKAIVYKSTNAAVNWAATNGGLALDGNTTLALAVSPTSPDTVYAGTAPSVTTARVWRTTNGGTSWTDVTVTLPNRFPMDLKVDPTDSRIVYAAMGGFGTGHVFKTTDAGGSWTDISGTIPDAPATSILIDPENTNVVYVGTDITVYVSTNAGATWSTFGDGLPDGVIVSDLSLSPSNRAIRLGTHGNGAYERKMLGELPADYYDYRAYSLTLPAAGGTYNEGQLLSPLGAKVRNNGAEAGVDSFDVKLRIFQGLTEHYSATVKIGPLAVAEIRDVEFPGSFTPGDSGTYSVQLISFEADDDPTNDTLSSTFRALSAPTIATYSFEKEFCPWSELMGGIGGPVGDDVQMTVALPFPFTFDGYAYDLAQISTNGWLELGTGVAGTERGLSTAGSLGCCGANQNGTMGTTARPTKAMGIWWDDLNNDVVGAAVTYATTGSAPSRTFIVQWKNMRAYYDAGLTSTVISFQVKLHETSNEFEFVYGPVSAGTFGGSDIGAMTGIKDHIGGDFRYLDFSNGSTGLAGDVNTTLSPLTDWPGPDSCYHVTPAAVTAIDVAIDAGWNLVSVPVDSPAYYVPAIYPTLIAGTANEFTSGSYSVTDTLVPGEGYWGKFPLATTESVNGIPLDTVVVALDSGWNLFGSVGHTTAVPAGGILTGRVWGYSSGYEIATSIEVGKGYWVQATAAGSIVLGPGAAPSVAGYASSGGSATGGSSPAGDLLTSSLPPGIALRDAAGQSRKLYVVADEPAEREYAMPPLPPPGIFDVRFAGGSMAAYRETPIRFHGASWPVTVSLHGTSQRELTIVESRGGKEVAEHAVPPGSDVMLDGTSGSTFSLRMGTGEAIPSAFSLAQNYPNPFNPSTKISFDLPVPTDARLVLYDALGREVRVLAEGKLEAGTHVTDVDLTDFSSGVYFYRLHAGTFTDLKKMLLIR